MIQGMGLSPEESPACNDELCRTRPDLVRSIHEAYLRAGADIIETCSFNANAVSLEDYGLETEAYAINRSAAALAKEAAAAYSTPGKPRFVAGVLGPTAKSASISPDMNDGGKRGVSFDGLDRAYYDNARGLLDGGADLLMVETVYDTLNAKAAIFAINRLLKERNSNVPVMISATISDAAGRLLAGQTLEAFCISVLHAEPWALGLNCSLGAEKIGRHLRKLAGLSPVLVSCHPNAGMPNRFGAYDETPETMARTVEAFLADGLVNIIGGCCGTTPDHIAALAALAKNYKPRPPRSAVQIQTGLSPNMRSSNTPTCGTSDSFGLKYNNDNTGHDTSASFLSGLEGLTISPETGLVNIGERTNVAGSRKFLRLIKEERYDEALSIARDMIKKGAAIIDICMDDALLDAKKALVSFLNLALSDPDIARVPVMIDSSRWDVIEAGLKCLQGKGLVNSISLKEGEVKFLRRAAAAHSYGAAVVVMLFDETGQAVSYEQKIALAKRSYELLRGAGFPPEDIVFDPNVLSVATGMAEHDGLALDFIRACAWIRGHCPGARISGGISNLSFSFRGNDPVREALHGVFLKYAAEAGLNMAIVNPASLVSYNDIEGLPLGPELRAASEDVILGREGAAGRLLDLAIKVKGEQRVPDGNAVSPEESWRNADAEEKVFYALVNGIDEHIEADVLELVPRYERTLNIVEGPLMRGMREVGDRFGAGSMFLPQVIRSARVMKKAVAALEPRMEEEKAVLRAKDAASLSAGNPDGPGTPGNSAENGAAKIVLATVKGDVHDIGKNIVSVVLGCNGYDILDLGVMIPSDAILDTALKEGAAIIGLSGLITPSLDEMIKVAQDMEKRRMKIPLLIGGATTSLVHTAVRIAPEYSGPVVYVSDASRSADTARRVLSKTERPRFLEELSRQYQDAAGRHEKIGAARTLIPLEEARKNKVALPWDATGPSPRPEKQGVTVFSDYPLERLIPYIDWDLFYHFWGLGKQNAGAGDIDKTRGRLREDAAAMLTRVVSGKLLSARAAIGFFPALSHNEDIILFEDEQALGSEKAREKGRFSFFRSQEKKTAWAPNPCLADFVLPDSEAEAVAGPDWIGLFVLSTGFGLEKETGRLREEGDDYGALLLSSLADRLAEAFAEELHQRVRTEFWAYAPEEKLPVSGLLKEQFQGIRPAFGYPGCPDHEDKREVFRLLDAQKKLGLELTESAMIIPAASVCGMYFAHTGTFYFGTGEIGEDQMALWAGRKGISIEEARKRTGRV
jgi:5-methyltetrahydrofolate--homocysteine methyltransferase